MVHIKEYTTQKVKKYCSFIIAAIFIILCFSPMSGKASQVKEEIEIGMVSTLTANLYPLEPLEKEMVSVYHLVYESLIEFDDDYMPQPLLAESWEMSGNGERWVFTLKENVFFSDGSKLTAHDVAATMEHILNKAKEAVEGSSANMGYYGNLYYYVKNVSVENDRTLVVTASRPSFAFLYAMNFPVLPKDKILEENPPGTGPYTIENFIPQESIYLVESSTWWKQKPQIKYITGKLFPSNKDLLFGYENMLVEGALTRSISAAQYSNSDISLSMDYRTNQLETLLINNSAPEFKDVLVRKALRHVINANQIASQVYMGMVRRTDTPMPNGTWMYNEDGLVHYEHDIEKAKEYLAQAGWKDSNEDGVLDKPKEDGSGELRNFKVRLLVYDEADSSLRYDTATMIKSMLAEVAIDVYDIQYVTFSEAAEKLKAGSFDLALVAFQMDPAPDPGFLLMRNNVANYTRYASEAMDEQFKILRKAASFESYQKALYEIQRIFSEDVPFICLYYRGGVILTREMFTITRDIRELELLKGIESYRPTD